jgi:hypothetical protein
MLARLELPELGASSEWAAFVSSALFSRRMSLLKMPRVIEARAVLHGSNNLVVGDLFLWYGTRHWRPRTPDALDVQGPRHCEGI